MADSNGYKTSSPLLTLPSAASGVTVTPSGVSEGWSSWVQLTASAATAMRLATIIALPGTRAASNYYEVEIGTGASGSETPVAAARGMAGNNAGGPADFSDVLTLAIPADVIRAGQRVSCRLRQSSTDTTAWKVSIQYWARPVEGNMPASSTGPVNVPSGSRLSVTCGAADAFGSWVELTSAADAEWIIGNVMCVAPNFHTWEVEIGIGGAGSEVGFWKVRSYGAWFINADAWQGGPWNILLRPTLGPIPAGSRVAVRARSSAGAVALGFGFTVTKQAVNGASSNLRMLWSNWTAVTPTTGGLSNFSAWTTLIASTATDITASGLTKTYPQAGQTGKNLIQLGVGTAGNEVIFAQCYVQNGIWGGGRFNFPLPYARLIPAGSRVAIRFAVEYASGGPATSFAMSYQEVPTVPDFDNWTSELIQGVYLTGTNPFPVIAGSPAWANGAWTQIDSSVPVDRVLTAYMTANPAQIEYEVDFGIGGSGSEVAVTTLRMASGCDGSGGSVMHDVLPIPTIIPGGSRLSARVRASTASATVDIAPHYTAEPVSESGSRRNLLTGDTHTVDGSDNLIAGSGNTVTGRISEAHGQAMDVTGTRAVGFSLDGASHSLAQDNIFKIFGDFTTTADVTLIDIAAPAAQTYGVVVDDTGLLSSQAITPDVSNATFLTSTDESADLPNSRQVLDTANIEWDFGTPNQAEADLTDTAVTPGSYTLASVTVDAKGRVTAASTGTAASVNGWIEGVMRGLGDGAATAFPLPDVAESLLFASVAGLVTDPLTYTLTGSDDEITFDVAPGAGDVITVNYVTAAV